LRGLHVALLLLLAGVVLLLSRALAFIVRDAASKR
jgi:hypothetical protein